MLPVSDIQTIVVLEPLETESFDELVSLAEAEFVLSEPLEPLEIALFSVFAVSFDVSSNESGGNSIYTVNIRQPEPQDLRDNARGHIVHDDVNGDRHITVVKKTQSFTNASK